MSTHSSILAWEISGTEKPGRATVHGLTQELHTTEHNEWEDYSNNLGEEAEISRNQATAHFLEVFTVSHKNSSPSTTENSHSISQN